MEKPLKGKIALVTGASRNIGASISRTFANAGADLLLVARSSGPLEAVKEAVSAISDVRVSTVSADVGDEEGIREILNAARSFGPVDVLVNNAYTTGNTFGTDISDVSWSAWDECIRVNLRGPVQLASSLGRGMRERGKGSIVNVVSPAGITPVVGQAPYGATKAALWAFTLYLAREWAPQVRANSICPGTTTDDESNDPRMPVMNQVFGRIPMGRLGSPDETAAAALWLATDASSYTTGQLLFVDGGRTTAG
jgi:NAD(P)-dependent dehydrogenase (short-subunit alcohol dehydrogenase family)